MINIFCYFLPPKYTNVGDFSGIFMKCCAEWQTHKSSHLDIFPYRLIYKMKIVCESHVRAAVSLLSFWFVSPHLVWLKLIRSVYFHSFCFCFCFILHALPANISQHIGMYVLFSIFIPTHGHKIIGYSAQKPSRTKFLNVRNSKLQHQTVFLMYTCTRNELKLMSLCAKISACFVILNMWPYHNIHSSRSRTA